MADMTLKNANHHIFNTLISKEARSTLFPSFSATPRLMVTQPYLIKSLAEDAGCLRH